GTADRTRPVSAPGAAAGWAGLLAGGGRTPAGGRRQTRAPAPPPPAPAPPPAPPPRAGGGATPPAQAPAAPRSARPPAPDPRRPQQASTRPIESIVDDRFEPLRRLVAAGPQGQPAPLDDALKLFNEVYVYLTAVDTAVKSRSSPPPGDVAGKLRSDAARLP